MLLICKAFHLVNGGETSLSKFFNRLVQLMKTELIEISGKVFDPYFYDIFCVDQKFDCWGPLQV